MVCSTEDPFEVSDIVIRTLNIQHGALTLLLTFNQFRWLIYIQYTLPFSIPLTSYALTGANEQQWCQCFYMHMIRNRCSQMIAFWCFHYQY